MIIPQAKLTPAELVLHRLHESTRGGSIITAVARFQGCLALEPLQAALIVLQRRHLALRVGIQEQGREAYFVEVKDPPAIPFHWASREHLDDWPQVLYELGCQPFDATKAPLIRVQLAYDRRTDLSDLMIACHHAVADGRAVVMLFQELAALCAGVTLAPLKHPGLRPLPMVLRRHGLIKPIVLELIHRLSMSRRIQRLPFAGQELTQKPDVLRRRVWSQEHTERLRVRAREEQTTLFGVLCAAVVMSLMQWYRLAGGAVEVRVPTDIRKLCQPAVPDDVCGCYSSLIEFGLPVLDRGNLWELARAARGGAQRVIRNGLWAAIWHLVGALLRYGRLPPVRSVFCIINNLGEIIELRDSTYRMIEFSATVNQELLNRSFKLFAVTVEGALNLTLHSPWHNAVEVEQLFDDIFERLEQASMTKSVEALDVYLR